jgi:diguanylate cyclase (GGDEF)-like protein
MHFHAHRKQTVPSQTAEGRKKGEMSTLEVLKNFFENYPSIVYITDMETHEIVYINQVGQRAFRLSGPEDYLGHKCYSILHEFDHSCFFCNDASLHAGRFNSWAFTNQKLDLYCTLEDTMFEEDGHRYRVEIARNSEEEHKQGTTLQEMRDVERIINEALGIALNEEDPEKSIDSLMMYLGRELHSDRVYIFEQKEDGTFDNTYEWCAEGVTPEIDNLKNLPEDLGMIWYKEFDAHRNIIIRNLEDYRNISQGIYEILKPQNIHTLAVGPLILNNRKIGFYGVDNPPSEVLSIIDTMFEVTGHFITALLRHRDNVRRLQIMSYKDQLTGLNNRNALSEYLKTANPDGSVAYFFCDLNGLKTANDTLGHDAGDMMIRSAAKVMTDFFQPNPVYRMGGDEFLAIVYGLSQAEAREKKRELIKIFEKAKLSSSIGISWKPDGSASFDEMFREADTQMYREKRHFHHTHPEADRRHEDNGDDDDYDDFNDD